MNPLTRRPTEAQAQLLDVTYRGRLLAGGPRYHHAGYRLPQEVCSDPDAWPVFQYVEGVLHQEHGLDAERLLWECPRIRLGLGPGSYGWIFPEGGHLRGPDTKIRLSLAGMALVSEAASEVEVFMDTLAFLIAKERQFVPNPSTVVAVEVWSGDVRGTLEQQWDMQDEQLLVSIRRLMAAEPATWHCQTVDEHGGAWRVSLSPLVRRFAGVATIADYVQRVFDLNVPEVAVQAPLFPSSLSLPEAIDYLNAVWRVGPGAGKPLIRISRAEAAAKLALTCATVDELESRLSALAGILGQLQLPAETGDKKLVDLRALLGHMVSEDATRAQDAVDVLRDLVALRVWRQHPGTEEAGNAAARRLGIVFPSAEWGVIWDQIRERAVAALSAIREEIEKLDSVADLA
jgi:hypothetical protein